MISNEQGRCGGDVTPVGVCTIGRNHEYRVRDYLRIGRFKLRLLSVYLCAWNAWLCFFLPHKKGGMLMGCPDVR